MLSKSVNPTPATTSTNTVVMIISTAASTDFSATFAGIKAH